MAVDWGASGRRDSYRFELVDPFTLRKTGEADAIPSECSITSDVDSDSGQTATIALANSGWRDEARDRMVRVRHVVRVGGESVEEVMGTFFVQDAPASSKDGLTRRTLSCYSTLWRLTQDALSDDVWAATGSRVIPIVSRLITEVGGVVSVGLRAGEADVGTRADVMMPIGTNRAEACRTLLAWVGCRLGVAPTGEVTIERALDASELSASYAFEAGRNCTYLPGLDETDEGDPYNRVVAFWGREQLPDPDDGLGLTKRCVVDLDQGERYAYERIGRRATYVLELSDPCTQAELEGRARSWLASHSGTTRYLTVSHVGIPGLRAGDVVSYDNPHDPDAPERCLCEVAQTSVQALGPGCVTQSKLRVIREVEG